MVENLLYAVIRFENFWRRASTALRGENQKIRLRAIMQMMSWKHPATFQLNRIKTLGSESIWNSQEARPDSAPCKEIEKSGSKRLCGLMSRIIKFRLNRIRTKGCEAMWRSQEARPHSAPGKKSQNQGLSDCSGQKYDGKALSSWASWSTTWTLESVLETFLSE